MSMQQSLERDLKMENQNLHTQIEALKPKSYENVVCDQMTHRHQVRL